MRLLRNSRHAYYGGYGYRRNPGMSALELATLARSMGMGALANLLERGGPLAEALASEINEAVGDDEEETAAEEADAGLTDKEAWTMLADLVPTALSDQPKALQDALVAAFREEARRAA